MVRQTDRNFRWRIALDRRVPRRYAGQILHAAHGLPEIAWVDPDAENSDYQSLMLPEEGLVISCSIDSDDAIHPSFVEVLRAYSKPGLFLNFFYGARVDVRNARFAPTWDASGPFVSYFSEGGKSVTAFGAHATVGKHSDVTNVFTPEPMWIQTVSGANLRNRVKWFYPRASAPDWALFLPGNRPPCQENSLGRMIRDILLVRLVGPALRFRQILKARRGGRVVSSSARSRVS